MCCELVNSPRRWRVISEDTSGTTAAVVQPKSRLASTRSAKRESPMYRTFEDVRDIGDDSSVV